MTLLRNMISKKTGFQLGGAQVNSYRDCGPEPVACASER